MLAHEFMRNAFLAGTFVALACGLVGYFVVLRGQVFAGDALSHVAFTGALAAAAAGIDIRLGLFAATIAVAVGLGGLGSRARPDDVVIGSVFAWVLGLGVLFLSIFVNGSSGESGTTAVRVLFGSILGLSAGEARLAAAIAVARRARPAGDRPAAAVQLARPRGRPRARACRCGRSASASSRSSPSSPPRRRRRSAPCCCSACSPPRRGAARLLTCRPWLGFGLSAAIAVGSTWVGLALSYEIPSLPAGTAVIGVATAAFLLAALASRRALAIGGAA